MKTRTIFLVMAIFALCRPADADWRIDQSKYLKFLRTTGYTGNAAEQGPCKYATKIECQNAIKEYARQMGDPHFASMAECVECDGSSVSSGGTPEQQMAQGLANAIVSLIFPAKRDTSRQAEIERQNAIKRQQEEEQKKQAAMQAANKAWIDLQNIEKEKRKFDDAKKLAAGEDLLAKIDTVGGGELKLKTIETDFFQGGAVDLSGKQGSVQSLTTREEQAKRDKWYEEHLQEQGFNDLAPIPENNITESVVPASQLEDSKEYKMVEFSLDQIEKLPLGKLPAFTGRVMLSFANQSMASVNATTASILYGTPPPEEVKNGAVVQKITFNVFKSTGIDKLVDLGKDGASKVGIGFMSTKYGEAGKVDTELLLEVGEDTIKIREIWCAKWHR